MRWLLFVGVLVVMLQGVAVGQTKVPKKSLSQLKLDSIEFAELELPVVLDYLGKKARAMNGTPSNFAVFDPEGKIAAADPQVNLALRGVPFSAVLKYVATQSNLTYLVDKKMVWLGSKKDLQVLNIRRKTQTKKVLSHQIFGKLHQVKVDSIDFSDSSIVEVVDTFRQLDRAKGGNGNFVIVPGAFLAPEATKISVKFSGLSLAEMIQYCSELANYRLRVDGNTVVFRAPDARLPNPPLSGGSLGNHLHSVAINDVSVSEATLTEMMQYIGFHSKKGAYPNGVNMLKTSETEATVNLDLRNVSLMQILNYTNELTLTTYRADRNAITIYDRPAVVSDQKVVNSGQ